MSTPKAAKSAKKPAVKKPAKKKPEIIRDTITAPYHFTDREKQELGSQLAALITKRGEIEQEKAQVMSQYGSRLKEVAAQIGHASNKITSGVEPREMRVIVEFDTKRGMKKFLTDDKKKTLVRDEPMTPGDWQLPMFKPEEIAQPKPPAPAPQSPAPAPAAAPTKNARPPKSSPAGETSVGDAMDSAAAKSEARKFLLDLDKEDWSPEGLTQAFKKAAKKAGWTPIQISALADRLSEAPAVESMIATLRPHVVEPQLVVVGDLKLPAVYIAFEDGFPADKYRNQFTAAAKKAGWPEAAVEEVDSAALTWQNEIGDEPEAGAKVREYLQQFTYTLIV